VKQYWRRIAFVAIIFEGLADLIEPWPIKIVIDYVIGSKQPPQWLNPFHPLRLRSRQVRDSEELVFEALGRLTREKTAIVIAHRLTTVRKADAIFVLQDGVVVESGAHDELLARGGLYAHLHEIQFSDKAMIAAPTFE
jgi:hypothetical protein